METPVDRICVFTCAGGAEREIRQTGAGTVVRNATAYRVARTAMGASGEGVAPASVTRLENIGNALGADRGIRTNGGCNRSATAIEDDETCRVLTISRVP